jgi:hypothetical protein
MDYKPMNPSVLYDLLSKVRVRCVALGLGLGREQVGVQVGKVDVSGETGYSLGLARRCVHSGRGAFALKRP